MPCRAAPRRTELVDEKNTASFFFSSLLLFFLLLLLFLLFHLVVSSEYYARSTVDYFVLLSGVTFDEKRVGNVRGRELLR